MDAKHGIRHVSQVSDRKLARVVKNCRDLPGSELFQYINEAGERYCVDSADVNDYLREISGCEITAKDFRSRKCYIHPAVLESYLDGSLRRTLAAIGQQEQPPEMWRIERVVMRFLSEQQKADRQG